MKSKSSVLIKKDVVSRYRALVEEELEKKEVREAKLFARNLLSYAVAISPDHRRDFYRVYVELFPEEANKPPAQP